MADGRSGHFSEMPDHPAPPAQGGFIIKFDGVEADRCFACSFDYDVYEYVVNEKDVKPLPEGVKKIEIELE